MISKQGNAASQHSVTVPLVKLDLIINQTINFQSVFVLIVNVWCLYSQSFTGLYQVSVFAFIYLCPRTRTSTCLHSLRAMVSLPWVSLMIALTLGLDSQQRITGMLKTVGKEKLHLGNDMVPGNQEVAMVQEDKQGDTREFPL